MVVVAGAVAPGPQHTPHVFHPCPSRSLFLLLHSRRPPPKLNDDDQVVLPGLYQNEYNMLCSLSYIAELGRHGGKISL